MSYRSSFNYEEVDEGGNYLIRHWRGRLPLPVSYWVNGVLLAGIASLVAISLVSFLEESGLSLQALAAVYLVHVGFAALLWLWSMVGIWRSAGFHEERGGAAGWALIARILVVFGFFGVLGQMQGSTLAAAEYAQLAAGRDPLGGPAEMTVQADGKSVLVDGDLTLGTAARFSVVVEERPELARILLRSAGGRTFEAEQMARLIAARGLDTEVREECASACTLVLLAGRERSATAQAKVGFHQPTFPGMTIEDQRIATNELRKLYESAGVRSDFLDTAMSIEAARMWYPSHAELIEAKVLNTTDVVVSRKDRERRRAQLARYLEHSANEINAAGRVELDEITTRTGAKASRNILTLKFQLDLDRQDLEIASARSQFHPVVREDACSDPATRRAIRTGATIMFSYQDRGGQHIFDLPVDECEEV